MIKIGTICMLTGDHSRAGQCCEVKSPLLSDGIGLHRTTGQRVRLFPHYEIALASGEPPPAPAYTWVATPAELIPIAPPGLTEGEDTRQPVREVA